MLLKDLKNPSYIFGLLLSDGYFIKSKDIINGIGIELKIQDYELLEQFQNEFKNAKITKRTRDTNFKNNYVTCVFAFYNREFCRDLIENGFPKTNKSEMGTIPNFNYCELDFWRGYIDGNGSLGIRKTGNSFISVTIKSEQLNIHFCNFLQRITNKTYKPNRNKRDNIYNTGCGGESAYLVIKKLYDNDKIALKRKKDIANKIIMNYTPRTLEEIINGKN